MSEPKILPTKKEKKQKSKENKQMIGKKRNISNDENDSDNEKILNKQLDKKLEKELAEMEERNKKFIEQCESHPMKFIPPENPEVHPDTKALKFEIVATFHKARAGILTLPHGQVLTPVYMPVGTKGAMKGLLSADLERMGCKLMLSNTYHLGFEPGGEFLRKNYGTY